MKYLFALLILASCKSTTNPPVSGTGCDAACGNMLRLGCYETGPCAIVCQRIVDNKLTDLNLPCIIAAKSKDDMNACGTVNCP